MVADGGISRMQTAAELGAPEPRRMASRPVDWMVEIKVEGAVVEVMVMRELGMEKAVEVMPGDYIWHSVFVLGRREEGGERGGAGERTVDFG